MNLKQIILLLLACFAFAGTARAQDYIYFDLAAGHVTIGASSYTGYIFQTIGGETSTKTITGSHNASNQYYVYQSQNTYSSATSSYRSTTGLVGATLESATMVIPTYDTVQITVNGHTRKWYDFITNQKDVDSVIDYWPSCAQAVYKTAVSNHIYVTGSSNYNVTIDGIWSSYNYASNNDGPIKVTPSGSGVTTLKVRGDNRIRNILWQCNTLNTAKLIITSYTGDGSNKGSLTVADLTHDHPADQLAVIGYHSHNNYGLWFSGATVFAGFPAFNNYVWRDRNEVKFPVCVGGGANGHGEVVITGGTLTAVSNGTTAAIGGGGGYNITGGYGLVTIKGNSHVYAYAHGIYSINSDRAGFVPTTAIGGASTFVQDAYDGTVVDISENAYVYAESVGGAAIGGGNARNSQGGGATINISNTAHVEARSVSDVITIKWNDNWVSGFPHEYAVPVGSAMGGGVGLRGGAAEINISGSTVVEATSIGGGNAVTSAGSTAQYGGAATINISGGTTTVDNNIGGGHSTGTGNGGAATITVSAGTISASSVGGGDAISGNGGAATITMTGGTILDASVGGGNTVSGTGGNATISISSTDGPSLFRGGSIGGGDADNSNPSATPPVPNTATGNGGNASIYVTGGTLDCMSIGGGDSGTGTPGSVSHATRAGIQIEGSDKIVVKSGYIGGGSNTAGNLGKATVYINATHIHDTIQGQFVLCDNYSTPSNHCYFTMEAGLINNHGLEGIDGTHYPRKRLQGGAVYMEDPNGVVNISGGTIKRSGGTLGGAVYMTNGSFTLSGSAVIDSCYATSGTDVGLGGGVYMGGGEFTMTGGTMQRCMAPDKGGAVYLGGGTVNMSGGTVGGSAANTDMNTAVNAGGGIYMAGGSFTMTGGNLQYNKVTATDGEGVGTADGGGVYIASGGTANFHGGNIKGNTATRWGGGFYVDPGSSGATLINSSSADTKINGNRAVLGGGAYIKSGTVTVSQPSHALYIYDNEASDQGGGIYMENGTFNLQGGTVGGYSTGRDVTNYSGNRALGTSSGVDGNGGGLYMAAGTFNLSGTGSLGATAGGTCMNTAEDYGGGLYMAGGTFTMTGGYVQNNKTVTEGSTTGDGGGVYIASGGAASITGGVIQGNVAKRNGGGFYVNPGDEGSTPINSSSTNTQIYGNSAVLGGGAYIASGTVTLSQPSHELTVFGNTASDKGGGIYLANGTFNLQGGRVGGSSSEAGNQAHNSGSTGQGGGLYLANGTFNLSGGILGGADATAAGMNQADDDGGGLYLAAGTFKMTGGHLQYNEATGGHGGGVYVYNGGLAKIYGGNITGNTAPLGNGGGFYVDPGAAITTPINSSDANLVISDNSAVLGGGGYIASGTVNLSESNSHTTKVFGNSATNGGGLYQAAGDFYMASGTVGADNLANGNTATNDGGGIYVNKTGETPSNFYMDGGSVKYNSTTAQDGGGIYIADAGVAQIRGGVIQGNQANRNGGGFYVNPGSAGTTPINTISASIEISGNRAVLGGGAYIASGTVNLSESSDRTTRIFGNYATNNGGGIYMAAGSFNLGSGTVGADELANGNVAANNGGGIYVNKTGETPSTFNMTGGSVKYNKTNVQDGGGVYVYNGGVANIHGGTIQGNQACRNGGGFYVNPGAGFTTTINSTVAATEISGNSAVKGGGAYVASGTVELSDGVLETSVFNNAASSDGGGVYVAGGDFTMSSGTFSSNTAVDGGGVYVSSGAVTVTGGTFDGNKAISSDGGHGGGIFAGGGSVNFKSATLSNNVTVHPDDDDDYNGYGGGIYTTGTGTTVTLDKTSSGSAAELYGNKAKQGGAVFGGATVSEGNAVTVNHAYIGGTGSGQANTAAESGGGIYASGSVELGDGAVVQCNSAADGGGAYVSGGSLTMSTGTTAPVIKKNSASQDGGGAYVNGGAFTMNAGTIGGAVADANQATRNGGGVYVTGSGASVAVNSGCTVSYNTAGTSGGGVYAAQGDVALASATLSNNTATAGNGGGAYVMGNATVTGSILTSNSAPATTSGNGLGGAVYVGTGGTFTLDGSEVAGNTAGQFGGGFYVNPTGSAVTLVRNKSHIHGNNAVKGGGAYVASGKLQVQTAAGAKDDPTRINSNVASSEGGGVFVEGGNVEVIEATMDGNTATSNGGAIYASGGEVTLTQSTLSNNSSTGGSGGGIYAHGGAVTSNGSTLTYNTALAGNGGGAYADGGTITVQKYSTTLSSLTYNSAKNGGALYAAGGSVELTEATVDHNSATTGNGGAVYATGGGNVTSNGSTISNNTASAGDGGGVYAAGGTITVQKQSTTRSSLTSNSANNGGALYAAGGSVALHNASVTGNHATTGNGGAVCAAFTGAGTVTIGGGEIKNNQTDNPSDNGLGGAIYVSGGTINIVALGSDTTVFTGNSARDGGVLYMNGGECNLSAGNFGIVGTDPTHPELGTGNTASRCGGGIYAGGGTVNFSNGKIKYNLADIAGGGIYVAPGGIVNLRNRAVIDYNHIPDRGDAYGGGVYLYHGTLNVGENPGDAAGTHKVRAEFNYKGTSYNPNKLNNIYLQDTIDIITLKSDISSKTGNSYDSHIGFSVNRGFRPVIGVDPASTASITEPWLNKLLLSQESVVNTAIFDDTDSYIAIHTTTTTENFMWYYIYLWSGWNTNVNEPPGSSSIEPIVPPGAPDPDTISNSTAHYHIYTPEGLSWFSSLVNGLGVKIEIKYNEATSQYDTIRHPIPPHPYISGYLEADVNMEGFLWIPIGGVAQNSYSPENVQHMSAIFQPGGKFCGTFDGQGHTVRNLECRYIVNVSEYGLFGNLEGATVKNVFVDNYVYESQSNSIEYHIGGLAGTTDGTSTISNCEAEGLVDVRFSAENSTVGGLVGTMACNNGSIHSSMALADIKGRATHIGGLIGDMMYGGSLKNSFANTIVNTTTNDGSQHVGGLVGKNHGTISNCYSVMRSGASGEGYYGLGNTYGALVAENQGSGDDYERISSLSELTDGSQVILAARYNNTANEYLAIKNTISTGLASTTPFTSWTIPTESGDVEVARELVLDDNDYYWTAHKVAEGVYIFTNTRNDSIAYASDPPDSLFYVGHLLSSEVDKAKWTVTQATSAATAMVHDGSSGYTGFTITNVATPTRGFGIHKKGDKYYCAAYNTSDIADGAYNFYFDIFKRGTPTIKGTVEYSYAYCAGDTTAMVVTGTDTSPYTEENKTGNLTQYGYFTPTDLTDGKYGFRYKGQRVHLASNLDDGTYVTSTTNGPMEFINTNSVGSYKDDYILKGLLVALNDWVKKPANGWDGTTNTNGYSLWTRTMGSPINEDYPVLKFNDFTCMGSKTGSRYIDYKKDVTTTSKTTTTTYGLNTMIDEYNRTTGGGVIYPYVGRPTITESTESNVKLYLEPKMILGQDPGVITNACVGVIFDNSDHSVEVGGKPYDWHMFATPLIDAPLGLTYADYAVTGYEPGFHNTPPEVTIEAGCYFPSNTPYGTPYSTTGSFDFYCYHEYSRHWINFKRASDDHWHENGDHGRILYNNETELRNGKGYLLAVSEETLLSAEGTLQNSDLTFKAAYSEEGDYGGLYDHLLAGTNLVGNPYNRYLDFNAFAVENAPFQSYYILDADKKGYICYTYNATPTADLAPRFISPHQGFFIKTYLPDIDVKFETTMSKTWEEVVAAETEHPGYLGYYYFRGEPAGYPLVNLVSTDSKGMREYATIEVNRPELGGGEKLMGMRTGTASMYFHINDTDYQIAFVPKEVKTAPVRFEVVEDDTYTFTWNTANADFTYLHLIDNLTGMDIDCLTHSEYKFEGRTTDYKSRFRLEFDYDIDEPEVNDDENETFAFMMGNELVVNGEGVLQVFDVLGRQLMGVETQGIQSTFMLPTVAEGVYVLRLTTGSVTKTQKLVIKR